MTMQKGLRDSPDAECAADLFHSLGDPGRLTILAHLLTGEHNVRELTDHLGLAQSTVSAHLAKLRDCGLVTSRAEGRASVFSINHAAQVVNLLAAATDLLERTGHQSPTHRKDDAR